MAEETVPHMCNEAGTENIRVGVKKLMCMGALPPFDHPHVFVDMGEGTRGMCPYCSTLYVFDPELGPEETDPPGAICADTAQDVS